MSNPTPPQQPGGDKGGPTEPRGEIRRVLAHVDPTNFPMSDAIKLWEAMTGRTFTGNPATGEPWKEGEGPDGK